MQCLRFLWLLLLNVLTSFIGRYSLYHFIFWVTSQLIKYNVTGNLFSNVSVPLHFLAVTVNLNFRFDLAFSDGKITDSLIIVIKIIKIVWIHIIIREKSKSLSFSSNFQHEVSWYAICTTIAYPFVLYRFYSGDVLGQSEMEELKVHLQPRSLQQFHIPVSHELPVVVPHTTHTVASWGYEFHAAWYTLRFVDESLS